MRGGEGGKGRGGEGREGEGRTTSVKLIMYEVLERLSVEDAIMCCMHIATTRCSTFVCVRVSVCPGVSDADCTADEEQELSGPQAGGGGDAGEHLGDLLRQDWHTHTKQDDCG